jgi:hypothetical protein
MIRGRRRSSGEQKRRDHHEEVKFQKRKMMNSIKNIKTHEKTYEHEHYIIG